MDATPTRMIWPLGRAGTVTLTASPADVMRPACAGWARAAAAPGLGLEPCEPQRRRLRAGLFIIISVD